VEQHVIEGFLPVPRSLDEDRELPADLFLADVLGERLGTQRALESLFLRRDGRRRDQAVGFDGHPLSYRPPLHVFDNDLSACRMLSETESPSGRCFTASCASLSL